MPGEIAEAEWSIYRRYRRLLNDLGLEDEPGFELWASRVLRDDPPAGLAEPRRVVVVEPSGSRAIRIALDGLRQRADFLTLTLPYDPEPTRSEAFADAKALLTCFLDWGFDEEAIPSDTSRPSGIAGLTTDLFRDATRDALDRTDGLTILGAPDGEGEALVVSRRVRDLLATGCDPDDVLVVVPRVEERSQLLVETLRGWGIRSAFAHSSRLATASSVAALRLAMTLPTGGWDAGQVVRLLRHGRVRPDWPEVDGAMAMAAAATAIRNSRVYRGVDTIRDAIRRAASPDESENVDERTISRRRKAARAVAARPIVERLIAAIGAAARPGSWSVQIGRLFILAETLGIREDVALASLRIALDDVGEIFARLGRGQEVWSWAAFAAEVSGMILDLEIPPSIGETGEVTVATVEQAEGVSARHVILANLAEGTFPARAALELDEGDAAESRSLSVGREMARFLRAVNRGLETLTMTFPSADEKGQRLLPAGFLDEVNRLFTAPARASMTTRIDRLDAVLPSRLAVSPSEARVRAVARACLEGETTELDRLARMTCHRGPLEGTARALKLTHWRTRRSRFHRFDGRLESPRIVDRLARDFGGDRRPYSASQLESLALCPFQFLQRYVMGLESSEERREFEEDHPARGSLLHRALEDLHGRLRDIPNDDNAAMADRVERGIEAAFDTALSREREPTSEIEHGLRAIESERLRRMARRYAGQFRSYAEADGRSASCQHLEVAFGGTQGGFAPLQIGEPPHVVKIQGVIDRIDVIEGDGRSLFRVIDYKTGAAPSTREIEDGIALQLPLYAIAAQRVILTGDGVAPLDAAYWALKANGFRAAKSMTGMVGDIRKIEDAWTAFARDLEAYLLALVERLRAGDFPVHPRKPDCERFCDYRLVCRITQARRVHKTWPESPSLEMTR